MRTYKMTLLPSLRNGENKKSKINGKKLIDFSIWKPEEHFDQGNENVHSAFSPMDEDLELPSFKNFKREKKPFLLARERINFRRVLKMVLKEAIEHFEQKKESLGYGKLIWVNVARNQYFQFIIHNQNHVPFFRLNEYLLLKLENKKTNIYVNGKKFRQCKFLLMNIQDQEQHEEIKSIDEAAEKLDRSLEGHSWSKQLIPPETEFWGHCSNLQAWVEHDYDTRILHSNLAFPLLVKLAKEGDKKAKIAFKEEYLQRIEEGNDKTVKFLLSESYIKLLDQDLCDELITLFLEKGSFFLVNSVFLKLYNHVRGKNFSATIFLRIFSYLDDETSSFRKELDVLVEHNFFGNILETQTVFNDLIHFFKICTYNEIAFVPYILPHVRRLFIECHYLRIQKLESFLSFFERKELECFYFNVYQQYQSSTNEEHDTFYKKALLALQVEINKQGNEELYNPLHNPKIKDEEDFFPDDFVSNMHYKQE